MATPIRIRGIGSLPAEVRQALQRLDFHNVVITLSDGTVGDLDAVTELDLTDNIIVVDGEALGTVTVALLLAALGAYGLSRWQLVATTAYTATPASTSRITMSDTSEMVVGWPLKYAIGGVTYYGIVTAVSGDAYIDLAGAPLAGAIQSLYVGDPEMVVQRDFFVASTYGDGAADLLDADKNTAARWDRGAAYIVSLAAKHKSDDTGAAQPKVNVKAGGNLVSTNDSNNGVQVATSWVTNSAVAVNTTNYAVARGEALEVACTVAGSNGDAENLTVGIVFVLA